MKYILPLLAFSLLYQVIEAFYHHDRTWTLFPDITGTFYNSGVWGCFAAIVSVGFYGLFLFQGKNKAVLSIVWIFSTASLAYSQSRAAWVGAFVGVLLLSFLFMWQKYGERMIRPTFLALLIVIPVFIYAALKMYFLKPVSAEGRFYIWKISSRMLSENLWFGIGVDKFNTKYMYYQADYFAQNPNSRFAQIADNITAPFCEPLRIAIEQGVIGFALFMAVILTALIPVLTSLKRNNEQLPNIYRTKSISAAIMITLLLFSCFSYPFIYIQFLFFVVTNIAVLTASQPCFMFTFKRKTTAFASVIPCAFVACYLSISGIIYTANIRKMHLHIAGFDMRKPETTLPAFASLEPVLETNPYYLATYANFLSINNEYEKAIDKMSASLSYHTSYYSILDMGRYYEQTGDTSLALQNWELAGRMIPNRFEPLYLQIGLYHRNGEYHQADSLTNLFMHKERKVDAIKIDRMMKDVRDWAKERSY